LALVLALVALSGMFFIAVAALPYFLSSSYGPPDYAPRRGWVLLHIAGGIVALLTGPVQLWLGLADRSMGVHRRMGVVYMAAVGASAVAAFYLSVTTTFGAAFGAGLFSLGLAWVTATGMALVAIKRSLIDQHKEWMIRSYVLTFGFVLFRIIQPALGAAGVESIGEQLTIAAWSCWTVPLIVAEAVIQGRKILAVRA
jgi:uncharacterized membrane protein